MGITVYRRHAYDDVTLLASIDPDADAWKLEVESDEIRAWLPVPPVVMDSHLNWSTSDVSLWEGLRQGDATAIRQVFPEASDVIPAGVPFAVMWDVSNWVYSKSRRSGQDFGFRFTDPHGSTYEFQYDRGRSQDSFG